MRYWNSLSVQNVVSEKVAVQRCQIPARVVYAHKRECTRVLRRAYCATHVCVSACVSMLPGTKSGISAAVFASVIICVQAAIVFAPERRNRQSRVKPEPGPYRIWIPVRTASANWDRRIRHKSPCWGARIGRDSPLFSSLHFSSFLPCYILWMTATPVPLALLSSRPNKSEHLSRLLSDPSCGL